MRLPAGPSSRGHSQACSVLPSARASGKAAATANSVTSARRRKPPASALAQQLLADLALQAGSGQPLQRASACLLSLCSPVSLHGKRACRSVHHSCVLATDKHPNRQLRAF